MQSYCERCEATVEATYTDPKLRIWCKRYFLLGLPFIPLSPIMGSDYFVMLPMLMVYLLGFGTAWRVLKEPALCDDCGAACIDAAPVSPAASTTTASP